MSNTAEITKNIEDINLTISEIDRWVSGDVNRDANQRVDAVESFVRYLSWVKDLDIMANEDLAHITPALNKAQEFLENA